MVHVHPRSSQFKEDIIQTVYKDILHKPEATFSDNKSDVLAENPHLHAGKFQPRDPALTLERVRFGKPVGDNWPFAGRRWVGLAIVAS